MPIYMYKCKTCEKEYQISHSMKEVHTYCDTCEKDSLVKVYYPIRKKNQTKDKNIGDVVKKHIKEAQRDLKDEKEKLKKVEIK